MVDKPKDMNGTHGVPFFVEELKKNPSSDSADSVADKFVSEPRSPDLANPAVLPGDVGKIDNLPSGTPLPEPEEKADGWANPLDAIGRGVAGLVAGLASAIDYITSMVPAAADRPPSEMVGKRIPGDSTNLLEYLKKPYSGGPQDLEALHKQISGDLTRKMNIDINGTVLPFDQFKPDEYQELMRKLRVSDEDAENCKYFLHQGSFAKAFELVSNEVSPLRQILLTPKTPSSIKVGVEPKNHTLSLTIEFEPQIAEESNPGVSIATLKVIMKVPNIRNSREWTIEYFRQSVS